MTKKAKPKTPREIALWRAQASCRIGREAMEAHSVDRALYNLLAAVQDIALAMEAER